MQKIDLSKRTMLKNSLVLTALTSANFSFAKSTTLSVEAWSAFKLKFIQDGRVVDTGNGGISHTEGQGFGLLMSVLLNDKQTFDSLLSWTMLKLQRKDKLFSWKWEKNRVADVNNATDGELYIAWALIEAAIKWNTVQYAVEAVDIANAVLANCVKDTGSLKLLMPGLQGFEEKDKLITNPSYYIFPALQKIYQLTRNEDWKAIIQTGLNVSKGWGPSDLPADWLAVDKKTQELTLWKDRPARFGYEAIRVPLFLAALGFTYHSSVKSCAKWFEAKKAPAWVDLQTNATADYVASPSFYAVGQACAGKQIAAINVKDLSYYDSFLYLLTLLLIDSK